MFSNKIKVFLLSSVCIIFFFFTYLEVKSQETKNIEGNAFVVDGDTIRIDGEKIRFSGIDAPESYYKGKEQICFKEDEKISCGKLSKAFFEILIIPSKSFFEPHDISRIKLPSTGDILSMTSPEPNQLFPVEHPLVN